MFLDHPRPVPAGPGRGPQPGRDGQLGGEHTDGHIAGQGGLTISESMIAYVLKFHLGVTSKKMCIFKDIIQAGGWVVKAFSK